MNLSLGLKMTAATLVAMLTGCTPELASGDAAPELQSSEHALQGNNLAGANLAGANLAGANLAGANLAGANLGGTNLAGANLAGVNLAGTNLAGMNLAGANLAGTNLGGTNMAGVNLSGANVAGVNLAGTNLAGTNLAGTNLAGNNIVGTTLATATLTTANVGSNIHNLSGANSLLISGEDRYAPKTAGCAVMGIGSTAFPKLLAQNPGLTMYAAIRQLPWGFSSAANGPMALQAWEALIWGNKTYCSFVLVAPPGSSFDGVAGFIKAVFRYNAPTSKTLMIGSALGSGVTAQPAGYPKSYTGMFNAAASLSAGTLPAKSFVSGLLSMITATTNNVSVSADFSGWARDTNNGSLLFANVDANAPPYAESVYSAIELPDGSVQMVLTPVLMGDNSGHNCWTWANGYTTNPNKCVTLGVYYLTAAEDAYYTLDFQRLNKVRPVPSRCMDALEIRESKWGKSTTQERALMNSDINGKCDQSVSLGYGVSVFGYAHTVWSPNGYQLTGSPWAYNAPANTVVAPHNYYMTVEPGPSYDGSAVTYKMHKSVYPDQETTPWNGQPCSQAGNSSYGKPQPCSVSEADYPIIAQVYVHTYDPAYTNANMTNPNPVVLTTTSGGSVTDNVGGVWSLASDGWVMRNGARVPNGNGTKAFYYSPTRVMPYAQSNDGSWYEYVTYSSYAQWIPVSGNPVGQ